MSLRELPGTIRRAFDAQDTIDVVTRLSLIAILLSDHVAGYDWYVKSALRSLAFVGILVPPLHRSPLLWLLAALVCFFRTGVEWWFQDNHLFVFNYWCLSLALALRLPDPGPALATSARLLIGLSFAFATLWKGLLSPDYMSGSYFHFALLSDRRFLDLAAIIGRIPASDLVGNLERLASLEQWRPDVQVVTLVSSEWLHRLALFLTWWTVVIEGVMGVAFLWPGRGGPARIRNWVLLLFGVTTYIVATVPTFGWTLLTLGAAQCTADERLERLLYALTCLLVVLYSYAKIVALLAPLVPAP